MTTDQWITVTTGVLEGSGLAVFLGFLLRGIKRQIFSLKATIAAQKQTLEVMDKRISETEKIGDIYRGLIKDLPEDLEKYKKIIRLTKDEVIKSLEEANAKKDIELKKAAELNLQQIESQEKIVQELPELRCSLIEVTKNLSTRLDALSSGSMAQLASNASVATSRPAVKSIALEYLTLAEKWRRVNRDSVQTTLKRLQESSGSKPSTEPNPPK